MTKKTLNQNTKYAQELIDMIEPDFFFNNKSINRFIVTKDDNHNVNQNKAEKLSDLKRKINSIENCNLKNNSKSLLMGDGNINSPIMLIGEAPSVEEDETGLPFMGEIGDLLKKMLFAINIKKEDIYSTYAVNFRPPEDRKPSSTEIRRYSQFLQKHISIINPKIIVLMGSTAMESLTGLNSKISIERGIWKEVIIQNTNYNAIITFNPSYLLKAPENKKYSWNDLKKIRQKIIDLDLHT